MPRRLPLLVCLLAGLAACGKAGEGAQQAAFTADRQASGRVSMVIAAAPSPPTPAADFAARAAAGDAFELQAAQAASQRAANPEVKSFAAMMLRDHGQSSDDFTKALASAGQALPAGGALDNDQQAALSELSGADPAGFDKAYMAGQVKAHRAALALTQDYAQNGDNVALKAYATQTLPVIQHHYEVASALADRLK
ncbi:DUF4142 domain-containing protein [Phenylobacterium soli]|uniref:DUF4142 domain-containing protein n=1 Tax=Phenylobacterium soli TaxID=2170551 RepID=A0A328AIK0_9CAUL|nr:DUF4142 domain-containing protein [Phenylobacterium soli]RAK53896.1 hypothetical protein DJ017_04850 [Phenylobacterium soli]